jgi:hypothetical protein
MNLFDHAKIRTTPMDPGFVTTKEENDMTMEEPPFHYRSVIGCLTYPGLASRPDIVTVVNILAQFQEGPDKRHFGAVAHLMEYLSGTNDLAIHYSGTKDHSLLSFSDSNWKSPIPRSGYIMILSGGPVTWKTSKQKTVAMFSCEAELNALALTARDLIWTRQILGFITNATLPTSRILGDNQAANHLVNGKGSPSRTRHVALKFHFIKELIDQEQISVTFVPSEENCANMFTKPLSAPMLRTFCSNFNLLGKKVGIRDREVMFSSQTTVINPLPMPAMLHPMVTVISCIHPLRPSRAESPRLSPPLSRTWRGSTPDHGDKNDINEPKIF